MIKYIARPCLTCKIIFLLHLTGKMHPLVIIIRKPFMCLSKMKYYINSIITRSMFYVLKPSWIDMFPCENFAWACLLDIFRMRWAIGVHLNPLCMHYFLSLLLSPFYSFQMLNFWHNYKTTSLPKQIFKRSSEKVAIPVWHVMLHYSRQQSHSTQQDNHKRYFYSDFILTLYFNVLTHEGWL